VECCGLKVFLLAALPIADRWSTPIQTILVDLVRKERRSGGCHSLPSDGETPHVAATKLRCWGSTLL